MEINNKFWTLIFCVVLFSKYDCFAVDAREYECAECSIANFRQKAGLVMMSGRSADAGDRFGLEIAKATSGLVKVPRYLPGYIEAVNEVCSRNGVPDVPLEYKRRIQALVPRMTQLANLALLSGHEEVAFNILAALMGSFAQATNGRAAKTPGEAFRIVGSGLRDAEKMIEDLEQKLKKAEENISKDPVTSDRRYSNTGDSKGSSTASGLHYVVLKEGHGTKPESGQIVAAHYVGRLENGKVFDSSIERGSPIEFPVGKGRVIAGWDEALSDMKVGEKRALIIPAKLGYGKRGMPPVIPPDATLFFDIERVK